ncbi:hypothetical protein GCM10011611_29370 [Aliidongia dinghuensis]|uniref:Uncharacterized protein n=1 Tax=Aliidongia dinghuensis TaxID=1867774 RepID=A0A8J2YUT1_9PROT|nr:hypothetical protein [Aliidongia dinghuensis]GGF21435.1 hypothetical protein GCM10011611_29370 [Aliidongia dinghuensis]
MSSISVQPASGPPVVSPVKSGNGTTEPVTTRETAKSQSTTQASASVLYPSPTESIDPATSQVVIEYRNSTNGEEEYQIPSKSQLRLYQASQSRAHASGEPQTGLVPAKATNAVA